MHSPVSFLAMRVDIRRLLCYPIQVSFSILFFRFSTPIEVKRSFGHNMNRISTLLLTLGLCAACAAPAWGYGWISDRDGAIPLKESIEAMMRTSHALKASQENRSALGHEIDRAKAGWGPRLDLEARGGFGYLDNSTTRSYKADGAAPHSSASLIITQPLWDGFRTLGRVNEAEASFRAMDHRVMDNANSLALDAVIAHIDVMRRSEVFELAKENVAAHETILQKTRERAGHGVDTLADVSQAQSRLARAKSSLSEAEAFLRIGQDTYTRLTGHALGSVELAPVAMPETMYESVEQTLELARAGNPLISAFKEDILAARARKQQAKAAFSPTVDIEAGPSYSDRDGRHDLFSSEFSVSAVTRWNLFNSMADVNEGKAADARIRQSRQSLYDYLDDLKLSVEESWTQLQTAQEQLAFYNEAVEFNLATRDAYQEQFIVGQRSLLDLLDAENELFSSSSLAATANANALIAAYRMKALTGELLPSFDISTGIIKVTPADHEPLDQVRIPK